MAYTKRNDLQNKLAAHERALQHDTGIVAAIAAEECDETEVPSSRHVGFAFSARELDAQTGLPTGTVSERFVITCPLEAIRDGYVTLASLMQEGNEQGLRRIVDEKALQAQLAGLTIKRRSRVDTTSHTIQ